MIRFVLSLGAVVALTGCATPPSQPTSSVDCGGPVQTQVGGEAIMGAGSDGFISDADVVISTRITPGSSGCTSIGGSYGN